MNPQDAARAVDLVRKIREKNAIISQKIIDTGSKIGDIGKQVTGKVFGGVANAVNTVSNTLNAIPPSVDILPGPMDNLAVMGLTGANKVFRNINKMDDVEREVVGAVKAVRNINKVDDVERGVVNSVKAVRELPLVKGGTTLYHATPNKFSKFDLNKTEGGVVWFTDNANEIKNNTVGAVQGAGQKLNVMTRTAAKEMKWATVDQQDKLFTDQLIQQGYDGVKMESPNGKGNWYKVFDPNKTLKEIKPPVEGGVSKTFYHGQKVDRPIDVTKTDRGFYISPKQEFAQSYATGINSKGGQTKGFIKEIKLTSEAKIGTMAEFRKLGATEFKKKFNVLQQDENQLVVFDNKAVTESKIAPSVVEGGVSKPLYRGSSKSINESITSQGGLYLTEDKSYATKFAGKNGTVNKVYVNIKKPYDITEQVTNQPEIELLIEAPQNFPNEIADLKAKGYDAITYKGQVFVLNPSIIKSTSVKGK